MGASAACGGAEKSVTKGAYIPNPPDEVSKCALGKIESLGYAITIHNMEGGAGLVMAERSGKDGDGRAVIDQLNIVVRQEEGGSTRLTVVGSTFVEGPSGRESAPVSPGVSADASHIPEACVL
jgi:hypothetical protein